LWRFRDQAAFGFSAWRLESPVGATGLAGHSGWFDGGMIHPTIKLADPDPRCAGRNLEAGELHRLDLAVIFLNNSFGMPGIDSTVGVAKNIG
jgi:3-oxoacyl-[acyl-carrier-protein] synthase II